MVAAGFENPSHQTRTLGWWPDPRPDTSRQLKARMKFEVGAWPTVLNHNSTMKTYIRQMKLRRWFPPHDRYAATIARLCILREDFGLEMWGLYAGHIKKLDSHSADWRRLYFWRNLVRTLEEIRRTLELLCTDKEFKKVLSKQRPRWKKKFHTMVKGLTAEKVMVKEMRDSLGAHVLQGSIEKALNSMSFDKIGYIEVGRTLKDSHYKFARELVEEILLAEVPEDEREKVARKHFQTIASFLPVLELTDILLTMYTDSRKLVY